MSVKILKKTIVGSLMLLMVILSIPTTAFGAVFYLRAEEVTVQMPDDVNVTMWGYALDVDGNFLADTNATVPGPKLYTDTSDANIVIYFKNNLTAPTSIVIPSLITPMAPVFFWDEQNRRRVQSFTYETAPGAVGMYEWNRLKDGSFIYQSGTHPAVQVQMGLYGPMVLEADPCVPYPGITVDNQVDLFYSEIDPNLHYAVANGTYGSPNNVVLADNFDAGEGVFLYSDDAFRGTTEPDYADGSYMPVGSFLGGGVRVDLGNIDSANILGLSGGWSAGFNLTIAADVTISFRYKLTQSPNYEPDEYSDTLVSVDGILYGTGANDYVARLVGDGEGGPFITTHWQIFTKSIGTLSAGPHTIIIGAYNNKKTSVVEYTEIIIDEVLISP